MDSQPPHNLNRESAEAPRSLEAQMLDALERYAVRVPENIQAEIDAGETDFEIFNHRGRPEAYRLAAKESGNLGRVIVRDIQKNLTITKSTQGRWQLAQLEEGSNIAVVFTDDKGQNKVMSSDAKNWVVLHKRVQVTDEQEIRSAIAFYKGAVSGSE